MIVRSYLYVPGDAGSKLAKASRRGADALIVDLEDAVPVFRKVAAREAVVAWMRGGPPTLPVWVRVNQQPLRDDDLRRLAGTPGLTGVVLAKVVDAADVASAARVLAAAGDTELLLMPLMETATAVLDARHIARQPRVHQLQLGEIDLGGQLGITPGPDEAELIGIRNQVVLASAAAGLRAPVGPVSANTADLGVLAESTRRLRRLGFLGRACIHPAQIPVVHDVFSPTAEEVEEARRLVALLERAERDGAGVVLDSDGRMVDVAVLRAAHGTLALAERTT
jgi:citrate lyase subunit beta/citryl-CoA lyase